MAEKVRMVSRAELLTALADVLGTIMGTDMDDDDMWGEELVALFNRVDDRLDEVLAKSGWQYTIDPDLGEGLLAVKRPQRRRGKGPQ